MLPNEIQPYRQPTVESSLLGKEFGTFVSVPEDPEVVISVCLGSSTVATVMQVWCRRWGRGRDTFLLLGMYEQIVPGLKQAEILNAAMVRCMPSAVLLEKLGRWQEIRPYLISVWHLIRLVKPFNPYDPRSRARQVRLIRDANIELPEGAKWRESFEAACRTSARATIQPAAHYIGWSIRNSPLDRPPLRFPGWEQRPLTPIFPGED